MCYKYWTSKTSVSSLVQSCGPLPNPLPSLSHFASCPLYHQNCTIKNAQTNKRTLKSLTYYRNITLKSIATISTLIWYLLDKVYLKIEHCLSTLNKMNLKNLGNVFRSSQCFVCVLMNNVNSREQYQYEFIYWVNWVDVSYLCTIKSSWLPTVSERKRLEVNLTFHLSYKT